MKAFDIPTLTVTKDNYDKKTNTIFINLNDHLWLNTYIETYMKSHRRWLPQINLVSFKTLATANFTFRNLDNKTADLVFDGKKCSLRIGWK